MPAVLPFAAAYAASNVLAATGATVAAQATVAASAAAVAATVQTTILTTALVTGASYALAKLNAPKTPRPADGSIERKDPLSPRFWAYGKCKVSGPVLLLEVTLIGGNYRLLKIVAFGSREMAAMDPFYIDGTRITLDAGADGSDGSFGNWHAGGSDRASIWTYLGKDSQTAAAKLLAEWPTGWTTAHRLRGIPYVYLRADSAPAENFVEAFPGGEPSFSAVGGVKLYDPRLDSTNGGSGSHRMNDPTSWSASENQRLVALDFLTWKDGYAKDWSRIDWATWVPQIAMADEDVPLKSGSTEKRYRIATIVSMDEPKGRVLRRILDAGDQQLFTTPAGLIGSRGGVWQTPTVILGATEILEGQFTHGIPAMDRVNEFRLSAMLPSHDYSEVELASWSNASDPEFIAGVVRRQPLDLLQVPSNSQAQRLAKIRMAKSNPKWSGSVRTNFAGLDALGASAVNLSFDELDIPDGSFDGPFLVNGKIGFLPDKTGMTVSLSSIDPTCYDWSSAEEHDAPPLPDAPFATVAPVVSGAVSVGSLLSCTTGTWDGSPTGYAYQWKRGAVGIVGATSSTYTTVTADVGALISCAVTATNAAGSAYALSNTLGPVTAAIPVNTVLPVISGTTAVGSTLTTTTGTWTNSPTSYAYVWKRGGVAIGGATASSYLLVSADLGATITVTVTATNAAGSGSPATSAGVGPVYVPIALSAASAPDFCDIFVWGRATTDTGSGTLYAVVCPAAASAPSAAQIVAGTGAAGAAAPNANVAVSSTGVKNVLVRGLTAATAYKVYLAQQAGATLSNVVSASFTTDTLVVAFATNGLATGLTPSTGCAAFGTNIADPHGGTNAVRFVDTNDGLTNQIVGANCFVNYFNGVNKFHATVKFQGGAAWFRQAPGSITVAGVVAFYNTSTGAVGTNTGGWSPTPVVFDVNGWKMFSGQVNLAGADVNGILTLNKGAVDNSIIGITRDGNNKQDLYNIRITRV